MSNPTTNSSSNSRSAVEQPSRMSVSEISRRLNIGRLAVYMMLEQGLLPGIRLRRRWIITRHAFDQWERTCGMHSATGLLPNTEVTVN